MVLWSDIFKLTVHGCVAACQLSCGNRTTEWFCLEGTSGGHFVWSPCSHRAFWSRLHLPRHLLSISKEKDSTASLGSLCHCLLTLTHKKKVPDLQRGSSVFQFMAIASSPVTGHHWKEPGSLFLVSSLQIFLTLIRFPSWALSFPGWRVTALSAFPHRGVTLVSHRSCWVFVGLSPVAPCVLY